MKTITGIVRITPTITGIGARNMISNHLKKVMKKYTITREYS